METPYLNRFKQASLQKTDDRKPVIIALFLGTILIAGFFTQSAVGDYMDRTDAIGAAQTQLASIREDLIKLKTVETNLKDPTIAADLKRYASDFREDDLIESLFGGASGVSIQSISMDKGTKMPNGLSLANINVTLSVSTKEQLVAYLDYLTNPSSPKRYVIKSVSYPYDPTNPAGAVTLRLGSYYYGVK